MNEYKTRWWFQICFFRPYLGKISNLTNILAQGIFCWIENTPEWFEISKRLGQRRKPRCLSCPAAAWRGDGAQSCSQLRPIPFEKAHGLPAWRGSCRNYGTCPYAKLRALPRCRATQNISPPQFFPNRNQGSSSTQVRALLGANISVTRVGKDDLKIIVSASSLVTTMFALENERNLLMWLH